MKRLAMFIANFFNGYRLKGRFIVQNFSLTEDLKVSEGNCTDNDKKEQRCGF